MHKKINGMSEEVVDVLVVGYGPVGATLAALLGSYGIKCLVIEKQEEILMAPRAIALDNEALRILQMAGLDDHSFERYGIQEVRMHCPYLGQFAKINTSGTIDCHPKLITFYQPSLEQALRSKVASLATVKVRNGAELLDFEQHAEGVVARIQTENGEREFVYARYLVGADGAHSRVRGLIGQEFEGESYAEDWLIVDVNGRHNKAIDHVEFICDPKRPSPHMPAPGGRERWEFMLHSDEKREDMVQPEQIAQLMAPWLSTTELKIERQAVYRFHARCCNAFQNDRVFLVGDAAHVTPPFVGQGLVAGLRDVANLAWKLAWVTSGKAQPAILSSYDQERRPHAKQMIDLARLMGKLIMPTSAFKAITVHGLIRLLGMFPLTRPYFEELKIKPANRFINGLFSSGKNRVGLVRGGLLPQEWLRTEQGMQLSDDVFGAQLLLLGIGIDPKQNLDTGMCDAWEAAGGGYLHLGLRGQFKISGTPFAEIMGNGFALAKSNGWLAIVRPDRVVMLDGSPKESAELIDRALCMLKN